MTHERISCIPKSNCSKGKQNFFPKSVSLFKCVFFGSDTKYFFRVSEFGDDDVQCGKVEEIRLSRLPYPPPTTRADPDFLSDTTCEEIWPQRSGPNVRMHFKRAPLYPPFPNFPTCCVVAFCPKGL